MADQQQIADECRISQLVDENSLLRASLAELRNRIAELEQLADADTLTPVPNRRRFLRELERVVGQANRHGTPAAVLCIDIRNLKSINDRYGQLAGDAALIHVARLIQSLIRTTDLLARIGGDEFGLILDHLDHNSAIETAERIERCIAENPLDLGHCTASVQAKIGIATILQGDRLEGVLERADRNALRARSDF
jgi:diguanylate cyclase (GGDEF)-like protein